MKINNMFSLVFKSIRRKKKSTIVTVTIFSILLTIIFLSITLLQTLSQYVNDFYYQSYGGKEFMISLKYDEIDVASFREKVSNVDGIVKVFSSKERLNTTVFSIQDERIGQGAITLHGADNSTLPKIVAGTNFQTDETRIQLVCPKKLLLSAIEELFTEGYIDTEPLLLQEFTLSTNENKKNGLTSEVIKTHKFQTVIVGLYDASINLLPSDYCFVDFAFVKEMNDINPYIQYDALFFQIDDYRHYPAIKERLDRLKIETGIHFSVNPTVELDTSDIEGIINPIFFVLFLTIGISILFEIILLAKKSRERQSEMGIYKTIGYNGKTLEWIYIIETCILLLISVIIGLWITYLLLQGIYMLAETKYCGLLQFHFTLPIVKCLLGSFLFILIMSILTVIFVKKSNSKSIAEALKE